MSYCVGHLADKFFMPLVMDSDIGFQPDVATRKNTNYIRQHHTLSSLNTLKICSFSVRGYFLNFELRARQSKVLFSNPTLYWNIVKTMYRISPDRRIPVCIDGSLVAWIPVNLFSISFKTVLTVWDQWYMLLFWRKNKKEILSVTSE